MPLESRSVVQSCARFLTRRACGLKIVQRVLAQQPEFPITSSHPQSVFVYRRSRGLPQREFVLCMLSPDARGSERYQRGLDASCLYQSS